ncbi:hypothetical protein BLSTO_06325 [Blastocystis sp. subtype 1]
MFSSFGSFMSESAFIRSFGSGIKSKRSVAKRFEFTGTGKLKRYKAGKRHGNTGKTREYLRDAMHPRYLEEGAMYASIKKMLR